MHKAKGIFMISILLLIIYISIGFYNPLITRKYEYSNKKIPESLDGYTIVQLSDFHCYAFQNEEEELIKEVASCNPNIIVLTGDMIDGAHTTDNLSLLLKGLALIAPIYFVTGNHEYDSTYYRKQMYLLFEKYHVFCLPNESIEISYQNVNFYLYGYDFYDTPICLSQTKQENLNLLLYHNSEDFESISNLGYDLILSGHTHGGIIRLPFIGGVLGNNHILFPKYDGGYYAKNNSVLISSRGLGDSIIPRFHNPRELVCITLKSQ